LGEKERRPALSLVQGPGKKVGVAILLFPARKRKRAALLSISDTPFSDTGRKRTKGGRFSRDRMKKNFLEPDIAETRKKKRKGEKSDICRK